MKGLDFFINRPVAASVLNSMLVVCGLLAFKGLIVDEYPIVVVPRLKVTTSFRNASAATVEKEITRPIEEALALVEGLESLSSESSNGESTVRLKFSSGVTMDRAVMQVNEQLGRVRSELPVDADPPRVERGGNESEAIFYITVKSRTLQGSELKHFTETNIKNHFQGLDGVAQVRIWGPDLAMNIDVDPLALVDLKINVVDIVNVLKKNELLLQAGKLRSDEPINLDVVAKSAEDYRRMVVGHNGDAPVLLGDVATVDLSDESRLFRLRVNGQNAVMIAINKASDGNILQVTDAIRAMVPKVNEEIRGQAELSIEADKSLFVRESLKTIYRTIFEACALVILIIFLFLRHLRATLVPLVTIPISLTATFFALKIFGLSINTITLLAMVLAVGLVVDDAIVVLENIFRYREQGFSAYESAKKGASEIGFAIIAMTCTLMSVFLPLVFIADILGVILREFAITLASAVLFSGIVALTLSPLMCARLLKHEAKENRVGLAIKRAIDALDQGYLKLLSLVFKRHRVVYGVLLLALGLGIFAYKKLDANLLPKEDRGLIGAFIPMVPGFDLDAMEKYQAEVELLFINQPEVERTLSFAFPSGVQVISILKPWHERSVHSEKIVERLRVLVSDIPTINAFPWSDNVGLQALQDEGQENAGINVALKTAKSYEELELVANNLAEQIRKDGVLKDARSDLNMSQKAYAIELLREPLAALGIDEKAISIILQTFADRMRPSEFKFEGVRYNVYLQSSIPTDDLSMIYVPTKNGDQVPLATVAKIKPQVQSPSLKHLNQMRSASIFANLGEKLSLGEAKNYLDEVIKNHVPKDMAVSYEGALAMQEKSNETFLLLFLAGLLFIFAVMAIQFEGLLDPLIILLTVPLAAIGGILMLWVTGTGTNLYTQVGLLTLIGLITKHGILLTEFVSHHRALGIELKEAIFLAAKWRFRPIIMTTAATVLGALPLVTTSGAGVEARSSIGLVIVGGMIFGTALTLLVLPVVIFSAHTLKDRYLAKEKSS